MAQRRPPGGRRATPYQPPRYHADYESYAPSSGYTPPVSPPLPPRRGVFARLKQAWRVYRGLDQRARADSMVWWGVRFIQGLAFGGGLFLVGVLTVTAAALFGHSTCVTGIGIALMLIGLVTLLYYAAAPVTCRWIVAVPENHYWVVEDANGLTIAFLPPGRRAVPWQRAIRVQDYADFRWFKVSQVIENVLPGGGSPIDLEIVAVINFNPAEADPEQYGPLREFVSREQFEVTFTHEIQGIVRYHLSHLSLAEQQQLIRSPRQVETLIAQELAIYSDMGLTLASSRPVSVFVRGVLPPEPESMPPIRSTPNAIDFTGPGSSAPPTQPKMDTPPITLHHAPKATEPPSPTPPSKATPPPTPVDPMVRRSRGRKTGGTPPDQT